MLTLKKDDIKKCFTMRDAIEADKEALKGLHLEHVVVETNQIARAVVDEVLYCRLV